MKIYTKIVIDIETSKQIETESFDYEGEVALCGPAAAALSGGGGILGGIGTGMQTLGAVNDLFGPKGALVTGDFSKGAGAVNTIGSGVQGVSDWWNKPTEAPSPTTQSSMGLSPEQFKQIKPQTGQLLLRQATIGGGFKGDDVSAFGISPEEFNNIPPEVRQELLRKLGGR